MHDLKSPYMYFGIITNIMYRRIPSDIAHVRASVHTHGHPCCPETFDAKEKIPYIRHDLQSPQWQSVARVLVYGYNKLSYFPLALSKLLLCTCLFGEDAITPEFLLSSFKDYIPFADQEVLDMCLSEEFDPQYDEVLDFLGTFKCFRMPTKETIKTIISEIAHQELVQKPRYILSSWAPILAQLKQDVSFTTVEAIDGLYKAKEATPNKIISLLKVDPKNEAERQTLAHLKRFIKRLEANPLQRFLHFCTGSDVISCEGIDITFTDMPGFGRHPVVHTCGPLLAIPCTYESYPEFVEEFTNVMKDDQAWAFDIA